MTSIILVVGLGGELESDGFQWITILIQACRSRYLIRHGVNLAQSITITNILINLA